MSSKKAKICSKISGGIEVMDSSRFEFRAKKCGRVRSARRWLSVSAVMTRYWARPKIGLVVEEAPNNVAKFWLFSIIIWNFQKTVRQ